MVIELINKVEDKKEKPDMIPKPIATPSFEESTPLPAEVRISATRLLLNSIFPYESLLDKLYVRMAVIKPMIKKNIEMIIFILFTINLPI